MNYLAHSLLSHDSPEAILGALLGDFMKGVVVADYPERVRAAISLHRAVDRYTDAHPIVLSSRSLISRPRRRFAPVLVDVFYDHFLARHWNDYCEIPLPRFTQQVYDVLRAYRAYLPERLAHVAPRMAADDWLCAYAELTGMEAAVNGIARRLRRFRRAAVLGGAVEELIQNYAALEDDFRRFFPPLQCHMAACDSQGRAACASVVLDKITAKIAPGPWPANNTKTMTSR